MRVSDVSLLARWRLVLTAALALAVAPLDSAVAQGDTLAVEQTAIISLLAYHAGGRIIGLRVDFAEAGHAPPPTTGRPRPPLRQVAIRNAIDARFESSGTDTLYVHASEPLFGKTTATICVTVSHRGRPGRGAFYETVEFELARNAGQWVIVRRTQLGIT